MRRASPLLHKTRGTGFSSSDNGIFLHSRGFALSEFLYLDLIFLIHDLLFTFSQQQPMPRSVPNPLELGIVCRSMDLREKASPGCIIDARFVESKDPTNQHEHSITGFDRPYRRTFSVAFVDIVCTGKGLECWAQSCQRELNFLFHNAMQSG